MKNLFEIQPIDTPMKVNYEIILPYVAIMPDDTVELRTTKTYHREEYYTNEFWQRFFPLYKNQIPEEIFLGEGFGSSTTDRIYAIKEKTLINFIPQLQQLTKKALNIATKRMKSREPIQILP